MSHLPSSQCRRVLVDWDKHYVPLRSYPYRLPRLPHLPYTRILPTSSEILTPFFYTQEEKELIKGTEMEKVMIDWEGVWREEWEAARKEVCQGRYAGLRGSFSW